MHIPRKTVDTSGKPQAISTLTATPTEEMMPSLVKN